MTNIKVFENDLPEDLDLSNEKLIDFISTNILAISFDIFLSYLRNMFK